jgi:hypothetical protein
MARPRIQLAWIICKDTAVRIQAAKTASAFGVRVAVHGYDAETREDMFCSAAEEQKIFSSALSQAGRDPRIQPDVVITDCVKGELTPELERVFRTLHGWGIPVIRPNRFRSWLTNKSRDRRTERRTPLYPFPL